MEWVLGLITLLTAAALLLQQFLPNQTVKSLREQNRDLMVQNENLMNRIQAGSLRDYTVLANTSNPEHNKPNELVSMSDEAEALRLAAERGEVNFDDATDDVGKFSLEDFGINFDGSLPRE